MSSTGSVLIDLKWWRRRRRRRQLWRDKNWDTIFIPSKILIPAPDFMWMSLFFSFFVSLSVNCTTAGPQSWYFIQYNGIKKKETKFFFVRQTTKYYQMTTKTSFRRQKSLSSLLRNSCDLTLVYNIKYIRITLQNIFTFMK